MKLFKGLLLVVLVVAIASPAAALIAAHYNYNACDTCHQLHNGPSQNAGLLSDVDSESTCLGCHGPLGIATEVSIHDPNSHGTGNLGYITCLECHNPHSNGDPAEPTAPNPWPNADGGYNTKLIGMEIDFNDTVPPRPSLPVPQIREESPLALGPLKDVIFEASPADWGRVDGRGLCNACHGATHNVGENCAGCHAHNDSFKGKGCTGCHDGLGAGALSISVASPHSTNTIFTATGDTYLCEDCHTAHGAGTIEIPNNTAVGINYGSNGESGIALGSTTVTGATEAEICWNCHATYGISEWGSTTADTNGAFPNFDYGSLDQQSWVGATWTSANFQYKTDLIQSTHAANSADGVAGVDAVGDIRCSYCHDVHDLNAANGDTLSGSPFLRGSWMGNPYREDGAPRWDGATEDRHSYADNQTFGAVPRGNRGPETAHARVAGDAYNVEMGGYWIDQNSGFPTRDAAYDSATKTSSLCELCHGDGDGAWIATEVDAIDQFAGNNWFGTNGHANSVVSGSGVASGSAANIFTNTLRGNGLASITVDSLGSRQGDTDSGGMGYFGWASSSRLWGVRNNDQSSWEASAADESSGVFPMAENPDQWNFGRRAFHLNWGSGFEWGDWWVATDPPVTQDNATTDDRYHQFTCSKCHNPHASRLPRLMISNCLDVRNNTWDEQTTFEGQPGYAADPNWVDGGDRGGFDYSGMVQAPGSQELAYATSAQNCHRAIDASTGWNTITPPNSPAGAWP